nr:hypothetical protein B0A51_02874 [Rachicladosporium sp. CCFEE 5018]
MVATVIRVPFMPTAPEALAWSADNLIAVGAGETLCILVPRQKGTWEIVNRPASVFTVEEISPMDAGMGSDVWSLGEEQSQRHIVSLAWSPPGIAKFETCGLAVLHSNHVLAIWECTGRPQENTHWSRCLLINHAIQALYQQDKDKGLSNPPVEQQQVWQRINAFAWASHMRDIGLSISRPSRSSQLIAVGTGRGDLLIMEICSPYDLFDSSESGWSVKTLHRISANTIAAARPAEASSGPSEVDIRLTCIAWSDWAVERHETDNVVSSLAFIAAGVLHAVRVIVTTGSNADLLVREVRALPTVNAFPVTGPLQFITKSTTAVAFAADAIVSMELETNALNTHDLDGRWDGVTGLAQTTDPEGTTHLHFTSHLATSSSKTCRLAADFKTTSKPARPQWRQAINESKSRFNIAHGLGRHVQDIVWDITSSPSRDLVAVCVVCEPDSSPAHFIASMDLCEVSITRECDLSYGLCGDSAELMHFSMRQQGSEATERMMKSLALPGSSSTDVSSRTTTATAAVLDSVYTIRKEIDEYTPNVRARLERLAGLAGGARSHSRLAAAEYTSNIEAILNVASALPQPIEGLLSSRILHSLRVFKAKLSKGSTADLIPQEKCIVCSQELPFESLFWSRCPSGHQYSRCALTFLSIQEPGQSKRCRLCDAQHLNEYALLTPDNTTGNSDEHFARVLFTACKKCLYCGGKFVA